MRIGIIGSGMVAKTLGAAWAAKDHEVWIGARDPHSQALTEWKQQTETTAVLAGTTEAATAGEVILIAINPWTEIEGIVTSLRDELVGKIIIDVSNDIMFDGQPRLANPTVSMGERVQKWLPGAHVVKALNITPAGMMTEPENSALTPITWVAGNNIEAKQTVTALLNDLGWKEVIDLGDIKRARLQESVGLMLSIIVSGLVQSQKG